MGLVPKVEKWIQQEGLSHLIEVCLRDGIYCDWHNFECGSKARVEDIWREGLGWISDEPNLLMTSPVGLFTDIENDY